MASAARCSAKLNGETPIPRSAVACRIAQAFDLALGELVESPAASSRVEVIRADDRTYHYRSDRACRIRTLSPLHLEKSVEYYELVLRPGASLKRCATLFRGSRAADRAAWIGAG